MVKSLIETDGRRSLLARLTVKWKNLRDSKLITTGDFTWLMSRGLIEVGTDVAVSQVDGPPHEAFRFQFSGKDWEHNLCERAYQESELDPPRCLHMLPTWFYVRLTEAGLAARQSKRLPRKLVPFRIEEVEVFDEVVTEADRQRFEVDANLHTYLLPSLHEGFREFNGRETRFLVTRDAIRRRVSSQEFFRLQGATDQSVVGEEHSEFGRDLIAVLWPDLAEEIELTGSPTALMAASRRMRGWTGIGLPECHRDWRLLSEWADLDPGEISDKWLRDHLYPRLVTKWRQRLQSQTQEPQEVIDANDCEPTDFQYDEEWLTVAVCESRFRMNRKNLTRWATSKCPFLNDRLLRRRTCIRRPENTALGGE